MIDATGLYEPLIQKTEYYDTKSKLDRENYKKQLLESKTLYVGRYILKRESGLEYIGGGHLRTILEVRRDQHAQDGPE